MTGLSVETEHFHTWSNDFESTRDSPKTETHSQ